MSPLSLYLLFGLLLVIGSLAEESANSPSLADSRVVFGGAIQVSPEQWETLVATEPQVLPYRSAADVPLSGFSIDTSDRTQTLIAFHRYYQASEGAEGLIAWNGSVANCVAGSNAPAYHDAVLRRINYFRAQSGLSSDVCLDATLNAKSMEASLVMVRQNDLSHNPQQDFPGNSCLTSGAQEAASSGNLALGTYGVGSVDRLMIDDGIANGPVGHRRWFLNPVARVMGHGSIPFGGSAHNSASTFWVVGQFAAQGSRQAVPWPNAGYCPVSFAPLKERQEFPRWSFSYPQADFSSASVSMRVGGEDIPVTLEPVQSFIADNTLVWQPHAFGGVRLAVGQDMPVSIRVSGIGNAPFSNYDYQVQLFDPFDLQDEPTFLAPTKAAVDGSTRLRFHSVAHAERYQLRVAQVSRATWVEGAESSPPPRIIDNTYPSFDLYSNAYAAQGSRSFHLVFPEPSEQSFTLDRDVIPAENSVLKFYRRFHFFHPDAKLFAEVSNDGGGSWTPLFEKNGYNTGSSAQNDNAFILEQVAIPNQFVGQPIKVRFRIASDRFYYRWTGSPSDLGLYGVYIDSVSVTDTTQLENAVETSLPENASEFLFSEAVSGNSLMLGDQYIAQLAAVLGGHMFTYTEPHYLSIVDQVPAAEVWRTSYFADSEASSASDDADYDNDGLSNLMERALGIDPTNPDAAQGVGALPHGELGVGDFVDRPVLCFSLPESVSSDLVYTVEISDDLVVWLPLLRRTNGVWEHLDENSIVQEIKRSGGRLDVSAGGGVLGEADFAKHMRLSVTTIAP